MIRVIVLTLPIPNVWYHVSWKLQYMETLRPAVVPVAQHTVIFGTKLRIFKYGLFNDVTNR